jgi:hypothetical protein
MSKLYWKLFDALVYCALAVTALSVATVLTVGAMREVEHHHRATIARAIGQAYPEPSTFG